jgi:hypothetical protein
MTMGINPGLEARAAIREVAIWLMERGYRTQSLLLNVEAER